MESAPKPEFDTKTATPEDWARYAALLTPRQKEAKKLKWVLTTCVLFARRWRRKSPEHSAAFKFAVKRQPQIFAAFAAGTKRDDVLAQLQAEFEGGPPIPEGFARVK